MQLRKALSLAEALPLPKFARASRCGELRRGAENAEKNRPNVQSLAKIRNFLGVELYIFPGHNGTRIE